jgi:hypothetical protein
MMQHFVVCDRTGKVLRAGCCQTVDLISQAMNADERVFEVDRSLNPNEWRYDRTRGKLVRR